MGLPTERRRDYARREKNAEKGKIRHDRFTVRKFVFVIIELIMAIYTSSQAVLLDAVYDAVEFIMLLPSIFLIPLLYKPSNEKHPFGYLQIESMFVVVKGVTMTAVTLGLIANNIEIMFHGGRSVSFHTVAYFELAASILGVAVFIYLKNKK